MALYTFGCSFTEYPWPTWADIIGYDYKHFENWGKCGTGNEYSFLSLVEVLNSRSITSNDNIMICWSSLTRIDVRRDGHWDGKGNIFKSDVPRTIINFIYNDEGFAYKSIQYVLSACMLLSKINVRWKMFFMSDFFDEKHEGYKSESTLREYFYKQLAQYGDHILRVPMWQSLINDPKKMYTAMGPRGYGPHEDYHLTPISHVKYIDTYMSEIQLSDKARQFALEADYFVMGKDITYHEKIQQWSNNATWKLRSKPMRL
jgi:hypothetical protein